APRVVEWLVHGAEREPYLPRVLADLRRREIHTDRRHGQRRHYDDADREPNPPLPDERDALRARTGGDRRSVEVGGRRSGLPRAKGVGGVTPSERGWLR